MSPVCRQHAHADRAPDGTIQLVFHKRGLDGVYCTHELTDDEAAALALQLCDLVSGKPIPDPVRDHPARVRERELPALRERKPQILAAWVERNRGGGDAA